MLSRSILDRDSLRREDPSLLQSLLSSPRTRVLHLRGERMPVTTQGDVVRLLLRAPQPTDSELPAAYLGRQEGADFVAVGADVALLARASEALASRFIPASDDTTRASY